MGTASHDAEVHMVHVKEGTDDELLVVGVLLDENTHGENDNVSVIRILPASLGTT